MDRPIAKFPVMTSLITFGHLQLLLLFTVTYYYVLVSVVVTTGFFARGQDISMRYAIDENRAVGTFVGHVAVDSRLRDLVGSDEEYYDLTYRFLAEGRSKLADKFRLDSSSGDLTTATILDRERLCRFQTECNLHLRIAVQPVNVGTFFKIIDVIVVLGDKNDNSPVFHPSQMELIVPENADLGEVFQLPAAIDEDTGTNNSLNDYLMLTSNTPFTLQSRNAFSDDWTLKLTLLRRLDREVIPSYRLLIAAVDGGVPVRSGTLTVLTQVSDVNDNSPVWDRPRYSVNVSEVEQVGSTFLTLHASDADSGDNALVTYRLSFPHVDTTVGLFSVNRTSGEVTVAKRLDAYAGQVYSVEVEAVDSGIPSRSSRTRVDIRVLDTHNSRPEINLSVFGSTSSVAVLSERSELGRVVAHLGIQDPDNERSMNGMVTCDASEIFPSGVRVRPEFDHFQLQAMDVKQYKVILSRSLDRERQVSHQVNVTCRDAGTPPKGVWRSFTVLVSDENDQSPIFSQHIYNAIINETTEGILAQNVYVTSVTATDDDIGENARLTYKVIDDSRFEFRVFDDGTIVAVRGLDRETVGGDRTIRVIAHDNGLLLQNTATATVHLTVNDVNDHAPSFQDPSPVFYVRENAPATTQVGNITAIDADADENAVVGYRFQLDAQLQTEFDAMPFEILSTGLLTTTDSLDREVRDRYMFTVVAYDSGHPPLSSLVTVTVKVTDQNDNSPVFLFPSNTNHSINVRHTLSPNTVITRVKARDSDLGRNSELSYSRSRLNSTKFFDVKPNSGEVILVRPLSEHELGDHYLMVVVHDLGLPVQLSNQSLLLIHVYRSNQSDVEDRLLENDELRYTLLVSIIIGTTVVLSVAVIVTMVMIRHHDRQRRRLCSKDEQNKGGNTLRPLRECGSKHSHPVHSALNKTQYCLPEFRQLPHKDVKSFPNEDRMSSSELMKSTSIGTPSFDKNSTLGQLLERNTSSTNKLPTRALTDGTRYHTEIKPVTYVAPNVSLPLEIMRQQERYTTSRELQKQKYQNMVRIREDNASELSCDISTCDSGRGGSDVELHNHFDYACRVTSTEADVDNSAHPITKQSGRQRHVHDNDGDNDMQISLSRKRPSHRNVSFDLYPATFSPRNGSHFTTFCCSSQSRPHCSARVDWTRSMDDEHLGCQPRQSTCLSSGSLTPSLDSKSRVLDSILLNGNSCCDATGEKSSNLFAFQRSESFSKHGEEGTYVDLKHPRCQNVMLSNDGFTTNIREEENCSNCGAYDDPSFLSSKATIGGAENDSTSSSGSYVIDQQVSTQEVDLQFAASSKDVIV